VLLKDTSAWARGAGDRTAVPLIEGQVTAELAFFSALSHGIK